MKQEDINKFLEHISKMTHIEMARKYRFAPSGDPFFDRNLPLYDAFNTRFQSFGGMTPEISKIIGWNP